MMKNNKKYSLLALLILLPQAYAAGMSTQIPLWRPVIGLGGGVAVTTNLGQSETFPIVDPNTDAYYIYTPSNRTKTAGLFEVFLGVEHPVLSKYLFQSGLAYTQSGTYKAQGNLVQGIDPTSENQYTYQYHVTARTLLAQAKLMRPCHKRFYPYVLAGLGGAWNEASRYSTTVPPFLTFTREYANHAADSFAYKAGLGVDIDTLPHTRLGIAYRFSGLGRLSLGEATIDRISVPGTLFQSSLYTNEILVQLTYLYG